MSTPTVYGVTDAGFVVKPLDQIVSDLEDDFRGVFGTGILFAPGSRFTTMIGTLAERLSEVWDLAAAVYASFDPDQATGDALSNVSVLTGTVREEPSPSVAKGVLLTGTPGTPIASGLILSVVGAPDSRFELLDGVTLDGSGHATADFTATSDGPTAALAGTLTTIETPIAGLTSATNPTDATLGASGETDSALRSRRRVELRSEGKAAVDAVRAAVLLVGGVTSCVVFENNGDSTTTDGIPPHALECVVSGGTDAAVAAAIFAAIGGGINMHGSTTVNVTDSEGNAWAVGFTRPTVIPVYVAATVKKDPTVFPADGLAQIQGAILSFGLATYVGGVDVAAARLYAPIAGVAGVTDIPTLNIGTAPNPTTSARITIAARQVAALDSSRLAITLTDDTP